MTNDSTSGSELKTVGWREWIGLPDLGIRRLKAKIDTGAKSSSLHAYDIEVLEIDGLQKVRFNIQPRQRNRTHVVSAETEISEFRLVRSSNGQTTSRPVIQTSIEIHGERFVTDVTLFDRTKMGFRMLVGRQTLNNRFVVDPRASYCGGKRRKKKKKRKE